LPKAERDAEKCHEQTYLMAGGAPAGISILPGELGCRTKRMRIMMTTMQGNRITTPSGTDTLEFPFNRIGRLKKASRDASLLDFAYRPAFSSAVGSFGVVVVGRILDARRRRSIVPGSQAMGLAQDDFGRWARNEVVVNSLGGCTEAYRKGRFGFAALRALKSVMGGGDVELAVAMGQEKKNRGLSGKRKFGRKVSDATSGTTRKRGLQEN
jgi:hypothetical protein